MMDIEKFYKVIPDPLILLSLRHALNSLVLFKKTAEIIGIVDSIDEKENLFKFVIYNYEGDRVQILAWGKEAKRIKGYIKCGFVTRIDSAFVKTKNKIYSKSTIGFDITIMTNTKVNVLKKVDIP